MRSENYIYVKLFIFLLIVINLAISIPMDKFTKLQTYILTGFVILTYVCIENVIPNVNNKTTETFENQIPEITVEQVQEMGEDKIVETKTGDLELDLDLSKTDLEDAREILDEAKQELVDEVEKERQCFDAKNEITKLNESIQKLHSELNELKAIDSNPENTKKYYNTLKTELLVRKLIDNVDAKNYDEKIKAGFSYQDLIDKFEEIRRNNKILKHVNDFRFSDLPMEAYKPMGEGVSEWDEGEQFTQLNTTKWKPFEKDPETCTNTAPCKECTISHSAVEQHVRTRDWDGSRKVSDYKLNKAFLADN